jgi:tRNA(adenine34) deaminase
MRLALEQADLAYVEDEVPVGAILVIAGESGEERIVARAHNRCESLGDPTAHAEMIAIREACHAVKAGRLDRATLFCTLEPCAMCAGAILHARIDRVVFGAADPKFGAAGSVVDLLRGENTNIGRDKNWFNHRTEVAGGVLADESAERLRRFFQEKRAAAKAECADTTIPNPTISR